MANEGAPSHVQVAPDGSGREIHTVQLAMVQPDGTLATVEMQVVGIADKHGRLMELNGTPELLRSILDELKEIRLHMEMNE